MVPMKTYRVLIAGLGNVGRNLAHILHTQHGLLRDRYGLGFTVVGAADSRGAAINAAGLDVEAIVATKRAGASIGVLPIFGKPGLSALEMTQQVDADIVCEATPVDLKTGQPGLSIVRTALQRGMHCVLANKGPLALVYQEIAALSNAGRGPLLRFSACVGGALPTINIGTRDLAGARITKVEAMVNGTCQGILRLMESGQTFEQALTEMQRRGVVEPDPALDIDGWDEAVKLVIIANAVLRRPTVLADLSVRGIRDLSLADLRAAEARGERIVLLGLATRPDDGADWALSVAPAALPLTHPLARMGADEMGVVYHTDIAGTISAFSAEVDAIPTAAAMLRDMIDIAQSLG